MTKVTGNTEPASTPEPSPDAIAQILNTAADLIDQHVILDVITAIMLATDRTDGETCALTAAHAFARWLGFPDDMRVTEALGPQWNDRPEQTAENKVRCLRAAASAFAGVSR